MGRHKKKQPAPSTPVRRAAQRKLQLDAIMRDAADAVLSEIRKMKDTQIMCDGKKVSVDELPNFVNLQEIARTFERRLKDLDSSVDALGQRLQKWRLRGVDDDPVVSRGRPRTLVASPLSSRVVAVVANRAQSHLGAEAVLAVVADRTGQPDNAVTSKHQQKTIFQRLREESGVIKGRGKFMTPVLIHATTCKSIIGKFHLNMQVVSKVLWVILGVMLWVMMNDDLSRLATMQTTLDKCVCHVRVAYKVNTSASSVSVLPKAQQI
jgi:hypothetical protein